MCHALAMDETRLRPTAVLPTNSLDGRAVLLQAPKDSLHGIQDTRSVVVERTVSGRTPIFFK